MILTTVKLRGKQHIFIRYCKASYLAFSVLFLVFLVLFVYTREPCWASHDSDMLQSEILWNVGGE